VALLASVSSGVGVEGSGAEGLEPGEEFTHPPVVVVKTSRCRFLRHTMADLAICVMQDRRTRQLAGGCCGQDCAQSQSDQRMGRSGPVAGEQHPAAVARGDLAERPEARADFFREQLRLLPGREVAAPAGLVKVDDVG